MTTKELEDCWTETSPASDFPQDKYKTSEWFEIVDEEGEPHVFRANWDYNDLLKEVVNNNADFSNLKKRYPEIDWGNLIDQEEYPWNKLEDDFYPEVDLDDLAETLCREFYDTDWFRNFILERALSVIEEGLEE